MTVFGGSSEDDQSTAWVGIAAEADIRRCFANGQHTVSNVISAIPRSSSSLA